MQATKFQKIGPIHFNPDNVVAVVDDLGGAIVVVVGSTPIQIQGQKAAEIVAKFENRGGEDAGPVHVIHRGDNPI